MGIDWEVSCLAYLHCAYLVLSWVYAPALYEGGHGNRSKGEKSRHLRVKRLTLTRIREMRS